MKILVVIDAPAYGNKEWGRAAQFECTTVAKIVHLFASRLEMGMGFGPGSLTRDKDVSLHYKIERSTPAEGEAAA